MKKIEILGLQTIPVILADTEMMPFGTMDFALGSSGIAPISRMFGQKDLYGRAKFGGMDLTAHELTAAAALVFGQTGAGIPVAVIRGCEYQVNETQNIFNTMLPQASDADTVAALKAML